MVHGGPAQPPGGLPSGRRSAAVLPSDADGPCYTKGSHLGPSTSSDVRNCAAYELISEWPHEAARIGCGLQNQGNSCYLNSTLQCLTHLPPLAALAHSDYHRNVCHVAGKGQGLEGCVYCILTHRIRLSLRKMRHEAEPPRRLWKRLRLVGRQFEPGRQEDAHELLRCLVDACERDLLKQEGRWVPHKHIPNPNTVVNHLFQGTLRSQVRCSACGHESNTYDPFMDLSLDLPAAHSLGDALQRFTAPEHLDAANRYRCDACKALVPARKQITIHHPPNCLVIHLKRFDPTGYGAKITRHIPFPETLRLHAHLSHPPPPSAPTPAPAPRPHPSTRSHPAAPDAHYTLHGVLVHQGFSSHSGHYFAFVRSGDARPSWYCMNDSNVSPTTLETVKSQQAYILFYVASHMHALPPVPPATPTPTTPAPAPAGCPSSPASSTASAPLIGPAPRPPPAAAARAPYGPHLPPVPLPTVAPLTDPPPAAGTAAAAPLAQPQPTNHNHHDHPPGSNGTATAATAAAAVPPSPTRHPSSPTANGNGNGVATNGPAAPAAAAATRTQPSVTHFAPPQRRPLTKQGIALQRAGGAGAAAHSMPAPEMGPTAGAGKVAAAAAAARSNGPATPDRPLGAFPDAPTPAIPDAVLRLTQQQPSLQGEEGERQQSAGGEGRAEAAGGEARGAALQNGNGNGNGHAHAHAGGSGREPQEGPAGGTAAASGQAPPGAQNGVSAAAAASTGGQQPLPQQQQQPPQQPLPQADGGSGAAAPAGEAGGSRSGQRKRRIEEVELGQEPAAVEGKRSVRQSLLGALRSDARWMDAVWGHFRRCKDEGVAMEEALQAARGALKHTVPAAVKALGIAQLREVLARAADEATGRRS